MDLAILITGLGIPALLIWRYRALGVLVSIPLGWALLALVLLLPHPDSWQEMKFRENWPAVSALMSIVWCLLIASAFTLGRWFRNRKYQHAN